MSVELLLNSPPSHVVAVKTSSVSRLLAPTSTTRSPFATPLALRAPASLPASRRSVAHVKALVPESPSRTSVTATFPSSLPAVPRWPWASASEREKRRFSAQLQRTPSNQRGTAEMGSDSSTTRA